MRELSEVFGPFECPRLDELRGDDPRETTRRLLPRRPQTRGYGSDYLSAAWEAWRAMRRFSDEQILEIRQRGAAGERQAALGAEFGCTQQMISQIVNGRNYADVGAA